MRILSLFDGMACGMIAMQNAGITVDRYVAYEIDKHAIQTATHNFPMIEECGDVFATDFTQYQGFDWLIGGSPCTYWSIAQKNNRETEASGMGWELFSQYVRALHEAKPKFFIYENNKSMSQAIRESISQTFGFEPICINSALLSAQNRQRLYWVGRRNEDGTYSKVNVEQPQDKGILLRDILETGGDLTSNDKSYALTASYDGAVAWNTIERHQRNMVAEPVNTTADGKAQCLRATCYKDGIRNLVGNDIDKRTAVAESVCVAQRGRYADTGNRSAKGNGPVEQFYEAREDGKTNALTTVQKDNGVAEPVRVGALPKPNGELSTSQAFRIYSTDGKTYTVYEVKDGQITIKDKQYPIKLADGYYIIRKLTVRECMRLQTVPEWYEFPVSDSQAYKMLGNGWTCDVITYLINATAIAIEVTDLSDAPQEIKAEIIKNAEILNEMPPQLTLFDNASSARNVNKEETPKATGLECFSNEELLAELQRRMTASA